MELMEKILTLSVKLFIILIMSAMGILALSGALALLFKTLKWISEVM